MPETEHIEDTLPRARGERGQALAETQELELGDTQRKKARKDKPKSSRVRWVIGSVVGFIVFAGLGALGGIQAGFSSRQGQERLQRAVEAVAQFELGKNDLEAGNCDLALQRFQYVIELDASFPDAVTFLSQAMMCSGGPPTPAPGAGDQGPTPTPDLRDADPIFADAQSLLAAQNWDTLLLTLDTLRKNYPDFQPIEIDRMYYIAYRNRGKARISGGDLERGIFDLNRAEQIGPLDVESQNFRQWAVWYIVGASFWEIDWAQSVEYFEYVAAAAPNLHDLSFFTAQDRLAQAKVAYAQELLLEANRLATHKQWCDAYTVLNQSNSYSPYGPEVQPTADWISENCFGHGNEGEPETVVETETPTVEE